jgi:siderophore synthetase component
MTVTKNIEIFDYKLPVSATAMWNPANKIARTIRCRSILFNLLHKDFILKENLYYF